jgi:hypothetical protein
MIRAMPVFVHCFLLEGDGAVMNGARELVGV